MHPGTGSRARGPRRSATSTGRRGQSSLLGIILIMGITVAGMTTVLVFGSSALDVSQHNAQINSAEHAMTQFDSRLSLVALGSADSQRTHISLEDPQARLYVDDRAGWMNVTVWNATSNEVEMTVMNVSLGKVVYENRGTYLVYQGGGVWKTSGDGSSMVSPPEFHYRTSQGDNPTLTLPLVLIDGHGSFGSQAAIRKNGSTVSKYPVVGDDERTNPLSEGQINITVRSTYYEAWGRFFEERTDGEVRYDHPRDVVEITLEVPGRTITIDQALASNTPDKITLKGGGGSPSFTDSYNSSNGPYTGITTPYNGTVVTKGSFEITGGADLYGNLRTGGGTVTVGGGGTTTINGNVSYGGSFSCSGPPGCPAVSGWIANNGTAANFNPIGDRVRSKVNTLSKPSNNDNDDAGVPITDDNNWSESATITLTEGSYYIEEDDLDSGQTLVLDTSGGDITLGVEDDIVWDDVTVNVTDPPDGIVRIYTTGSQFKILNNAVVGNTTTDNGTALRVYSGPGFQVTIDNHATMVGLIYAPGTNANPGSIDITTQSSLYGGIVGGGPTTIQSGSSIHFDQALSNVEPDPTTTLGPPITFLHVSTSRVNVTATG